jgi:dipeptidyl aminopeptidase/acylaminoacyl peptidase
MQHRDTHQAHVLRNTGKDFRLVETEAIATFTALRRQGVPAELLYFPTENHWVVKPDHAIIWHTKVFEWLDQWLR